MAQLNVVEQRLAMTEHQRRLETATGVHAAAESRARVLASKAAQDDKRYGKHAADALKDLERTGSELEEIRANAPDFRDSEGTRAYYSDFFGNFARNREVANAGGIGVIGSNSTEDGEAADKAEDAGIEAQQGPAAVMGLGGRAETPAGQPLVAEEGDEEGTDEGEEGSTTRRSRRRSSRRR